MSFEKKYSPSEREKEIQKFWESKEIYAFDVKSNKEIFSIDTPPPTISGKMHIGHAFSYSQTDFIARYKRMKGFNVFYPFGTDDNGLATEKLVQKEKKINLRDLSRDEALNITLEYLNENRENFIQDWKNLGISADFKNLKYSTIDEYSRKLSQKTFLDLYSKRLIVQKEGPVPWDRVFQTAIAQAELEDVERTAHFNYVKAKIKHSENTYVIYATTRPELCFSVVGMSVEDKGRYVKLKVNDEYWITGAATYAEKFSKYKFEVVENLEGQNLINEVVIIPLVDKEITITHDPSVQSTLGTGIAYFCTFGGVEDIEWCHRHKVEPIILIDKKGKLNERGKEYAGLLASEARTKISQYLLDNNYTILREEKKQIVNVGERSGAEVEYVISKQWYVTYLDKKELFFEMAQKFNWHPEFMKHRLENWIKGLNWNWGFSRQRKFGVPIPVWYDNKGNVYLPDESQLPVDPLKDRPLSAPKDIELIPESDVLDTWFTSASTPFLSINLIEDQKLREKLFPLNLRPQAHDIINFWLFYTMAKTNLLYGENPFKDVTVSGFMLDPQGKKMSKSKGNTILPQEITSKFSNDGLRFLAAASKLGQDMPYQEKEVQTGIKVANKIYNATKFASMLLEDFKKESINVKELKPIDQWILCKLNSTITQATNAFERYDYAKAKSEWELFFMRDVADNYLEIVKQRLWKPDEAGKDNSVLAQKTLYHVLFNSVKGLAPILPFITEDVYLNFFKKFESEASIHLCSWPKSNPKFENKKVLDTGNKVVELIGQVRKFKSENNVSMKAPIKNLTIISSENVKEFIVNCEFDIKSVLSCENITFEINESENSCKVELES